MSENAFAVVCAWCHQVIIAAPPSNPVSHTICPSCLDWTLTHEDMNIAVAASDPDHSELLSASAADTGRQ
jgi:hypothetical protein